MQLQSGTHFSSFTGRLEERTDFPVDPRDGYEFYHTTFNIKYRYRKAFGKWFGISFVTTTSTSSSTTTTTTSTSTTTTSTSSTTTSSSTTTTSTSSSTTTTSTSTSL